MALTIRTCPPSRCELIANATCHPIDLSNGLLCWMYVPYQFLTKVLLVVIVLA